jgi:hypothetical protein
MGFAQARGLVLYNAFIHGPQIPSNAQGILSGLPRCRLVTTRTNPPGLWLLGWAEPMAELSEVEGHLKRLPGVERAGIVMRLRVEFAVERVECWIRDTIAKWEAARRDR